MWNSWDLEVADLYKYVLSMETVKQLGPWSNLYSHGYYVLTLWLCIYSAGETRRNDILSFKLNLTLKVKVNHSPKKQDLNQSALHLWSKLGDPSLNGGWAMIWKLRVDTRTHIHTDTQTDARNNNTWRPKLAWDN